MLFTADFANYSAPLVLGLVFCTTEAQTIGIYEVHPLSVCFLCKFFAVRNWVIIVLAEVAIRLLLSLCTIGWRVVAFAVVLLLKSTIFLVWPWVILTCTCVPLHDWVHVGRCLNLYEVSKIEERWVVAFLHFSLVDNFYPFQFQFLWQFLAHIFVLSFFIQRP